MFLITAGHSDVDGAEQSKDEGLDEGHQQLKTAHKDVEKHGDGRHGKTEDRCHLPENEYQGDETQDDDVSSGDVGEKSHHQHKGLGEDADELHKGHNGQGNLQPPGHARRVDDILPILLVA